MLEWRGSRIPRVSLMLYKRFGGPQAGTWLPLRSSSAIEEL